MNREGDRQDDDRVLIESVRDYARSVLLPRDRRGDADETPITDLLPELAEMGFLSISLPESLGGLGCSFTTYTAIIHELAYASPATAVTVSIHNMVGNVVRRFATDDQARLWLTDWGKADSFAAFAISEADAGSDAASSRTTATRVDDGYRVTGEKMWITNGLTSRWFLTLARTSKPDEPTQLSMFLIDGRQDGVRRTPIHGKMGIRASETAVIQFDSVYVPLTGLLGAQGQGMAIALTALDAGRIGVAAQATGIAQACLDEMVSYARQRKQFGKLIGEFQAVQNMIADSATELAASKELIARAAAAIDRGHPDWTASAKAKLYASEAANRIAYRAVQVHGASGYVKECRVEQLFRDARVTTIYEGTSEIQRLVIGRSILKDVGQHDS